MPNTEETNKEKEIVNPNDNFKNIISSYLMNQMKDKESDVSSNKPNNLDTNNQKKSTKMRVTGLRQLGDTKGKVKSIRKRNTRYA
tara:strand:+ start:2851 stop:3105 length:255 start_codon:yes stop_codon:yes gene_type:complete